MKIVLDRRSCPCWEPACETHFGWHFLRNEITPVDCTVEVIDDAAQHAAALLDQELRPEPAVRAAADLRHHRQGARAPLLAQPDHPI